MLQPVIGPGETGTRGLLADEQASLRRVATLVAEGAPASELFAAVAEEVGRVVDAPSVAVARYEDDGTLTVCGTFPPDSPRFPVGARVSLDGNVVPSLVRERAQHVRLDDYSELEGEIGEAARSSGMRSSVGVPIVVGGGVWGVIVASDTERLPDVTEARLSEFTELLTAAIANAQGREALTQLVEQQAALRRVASLVAIGVPPDELFAAVAEEVGRVVDAPYVAVARYESENDATVRGTFPSEGALFPTGSHVSLDGVSVLARIAEHGEPARIDDYTQLTGGVAETAQTTGIRSGIGVPIVVAGRVWGSIVAWSAERLPEDFEARLSEFTELLAAAISNTGAYEALAQLADEQASLRRVATLVAGGASSAELFAAVAEEVAHVLGVSSVTIGRFEPDSGETVVASINSPGFPVGSRLSFDGPSVSAVVHSTGGSARIDDYADLVGTIAAAVRDSGIGSIAGAPITVDGTAWGVITVGAPPGDLMPADTEDRLGEFTELVALAISNAASRDRLRLLADEQAALRRVATLVARDASPGEVFDAVAMEVGTLLDTDITVVGRYDGDGAATAIGSWSAAPGGVPVGTRSAIGGRNVLTLVAETGKPARLDGYEDASGEAADIARSHGWRSSIAAPIIVEGRLWGVMLVATERSELFPARAEERLFGFTELIATAIGNAESRDRLRLLADEQAALRRVATLVAGGASPTETFAAVSVEVDRLFRLDLDRDDVAGVVRFDPGPEHVVVGVSRTVETVPLGSRWPPDELFAPTHVLRGRSARIDESDLTAVGGETADFLRERGYLTQVASPIVVEGRLWGAISVNSHADLPADTEERLGKFTELVATAIANAESHEALEELVDEQAGLQRVATLVANAAAPTEIFNAVSVEVARLFDLGNSPGDLAGVVRFDPLPEHVVVGVSSASAVVSFGSRWPADELFALTRVMRTGRSARIDESDIDATPGETADFLREQGFTTQVASPIVVEGRLWGAISVSRQDGLPPETEGRLESFTELVGSAIANAESQEGLAELAGEQAALRRVATLVAEGATTFALGAVVLEEAAQVLGVPAAWLVRYDSNEAITVIASLNDPTFPAGGHWPLDGDSLSARILWTGLPARIDDYSGLESTLAELTRESGISSVAGAPIAGDGRVWGCICVGAETHERLPADVETRLSAFTDLVATAIANAESRERIRRLADEQAALRRVATLVAEGATARELFPAVAEEVVRILDVSSASVVQFDADDSGVIVASVDDESFPVGSRWPLEGASLNSIVFETGRPARVHFLELTGPIAEAARASGIASGVGVPIVVDGRTWGMIAVGTRAGDLPSDTEVRLLAFTDLLATAISKTLAQDDLHRLAAEQAALRRVATLVAGAARPDAVFGAVAEEIRSLFGLLVEIGRYTSDEMWTVIGAAGDHPFPVGSRWSFDGPSVMARVHETGAAARVDSYEALGGEIARVARSANFQSAIGAPIVVGGAVWGAVIAISTSPEPIPEGTGRRLSEFTELVATAVSNMQAQDDLEGVLRQQASLRRVATIVAEGAPVDEVFDALVAEVASVVDVPGVHLDRYEADGSSVTVATSIIQEWGATRDIIKAGARWPRGSGGLREMVYETSRPARIDDYADLRGPAGEIARKAGVESACAVPIVVAGKLWGQISVYSPRGERLPSDTEARLFAFTELAATAVSNAAARAELIASRARIVAAGDEARRRIERNLHDGTQQRLITLGLDLQRVEATLPDEARAARAGIEGIEGDLRSLLAEVQELSRGLHPPMLARGGLQPSLRALARRSPIPVELEIDLSERPPASVEIAVYYAVSEALTNAIKHSQASKVAVGVVTSHGGGPFSYDLTGRGRPVHLYATVADDGVGGAELSAGSGLMGLADRVDALGGRLEVQSRPGQGTRISIELPLDSQAEV